MQCSLLVGSPFTFIFIKYFFILFLIHLFFSLHLPFLNNLRIQFNLISSLQDSSHLGAAQDTVTGRRWHLPGGAAGSPSRTLIYRAVDHRGLARADDFRSQVEGGDGGLMDATPGRHQGSAFRNRVFLENKLKNKTKQGI